MIKKDIYNNICKWTTTIKTYAHICLPKQFPQTPTHTSNTKHLPTHPTPKTHIQRCVPNQSKTPRLSVQCMAASHRGGKVWNSPVEHDALNACSLAKNNPMEIFMPRLHNCQIPIINVNPSGVSLYIIIQTANLEIFFFLKPRIISIHSEKICLQSNIMT